MDKALEVDLCQDFGGFSALILTFSAFRYGGVSVDWTTSLPLLQKKSNAFYRMFVIIPLSVCPNKDSEYEIFFAELIKEKIC